MNWDIPHCEIESFFTITINGLYLTKNIEFTRLIDIPKFLTTNISDIPENLLSKNYEEMCKIKDNMFEKHFLIKRNDNVRVTRINKMKIRMVGE